MNGFRLGAAVLALSAWGCAGAGPSLMWRGHTPDRRVPVEIREVAGEQRALVAGVPGPACRAIAVDGLRFSREGDRLAYPALSAGGWRVVEHRARDGWRGREIGPPREGIAELTYAPAGGDLAFAAEGAGRWQVWRVPEAGEPAAVGPPAAAIFRRALRWSADGRRLAYAAEVDGRAHAVIDGVPGRGHDAIGSLAFTGDGTRAVYVAGDSGRAVVVIDGEPGPAADEIRDLAVGERAIAHAARRGSAWHAVIEGAEGPAFSLVRDIRFGPGDRPIYVARTGATEQVVVGGQPGPAFDEVGELVVATDGRVGYAARVGSEWCAVVDGARGPRHDSVTGLALGAGGRVGYLARRAGEAYAVIDGKEGPSHIWVGNLTFSADGRRWAYLAQSGEQSLVVRDDGATAFDVVMDRSLVFDPGGSGHWACLAGDRRSRQLYIAIDGVARRPFDPAELVDLKRLRPDEALVAEWVAAELALHRPPPHAR